MAQQGIIYPAEPLLIVDRQYRQQKGKVDVPFSFNSTKRDVTISILGKEDSPFRNTTRTGVQIEDGLSQQLNGSGRFQFVPSNQQSFSCPVRKRRHTKKKNGRRPEATETGPFKNATSDSASPDDTWRRQALQLRMAGVVPNSSTTFYGYASSHVKSNAQDLLNYYTIGIARTFYPLQDLLSFDINPVKAAWVPLAADNEAFLNSVLYSSETHRNYVLAKSTVDHHNSYFQAAVKLVNTRLAAREVDDATIGAVSCLTMIEHFLGNDKESRMHQSGLVEMIRVRGGLQAVRKPLQMKIYRADLNPSVDRLVTPKLPRIRPTLPSLHTMIFPNSPPDHKLTNALAASGLNLHLIDVVLAMSGLSKALKYAMDNSLTIPSRAFDEDTMGIQHDLLMMPKESARDIDIACRSACLIYMKSLTRDDPCDVMPIVEPLVTSIEKVKVQPSTARLLFWVNFMGAIATQSLKRRIWFHERLAILRESLGPIEWAEAQIILQNISWVPKIHHQVGSIVWNALETMTPSSLFSNEPTLPLSSPTT